MAFTLRRLPHDSHAMKKIRFSFVSSVSGDLHVLHVTYSTATHSQRKCRNNREVRTDVPPQNVFNLFLLEPTLDNQLASSVDGAVGTQFGK
jgi:hypothetical protein